MKTRLVKARLVLSKEEADDGIGYDRAGVSGSGDQGRGKWSGMLIGKTGLEP